MPVLVCEIGYVRNFLKANHCLFGASFCGRMKSLEKPCRIYPCAVLVHFKMKMGAIGIACLSFIPNDSSGGYVLPFRNRYRAEMGISGAIRAIVVNQHIIAQE